MKQSEGRRSFLFGVGAFAAGVLMPKVPKLIFPVRENPLVTPNSFDVHRMWVDTPNRVGNRRAYFWLGGPKGQPLRLYKKLDNPPQHLFDFDEIVKNTAPEHIYGDGRVPNLNVTRKHIFAPGMWTPKSRKHSERYGTFPGEDGTRSPEDFKERVFQLEKHFDKET